MPPLVTGIVASTLLFINVVIWASCILSLTLLNKILPFTPVRNVISKVMIMCATSWVYCNTGWIYLTQKMQWDIRIPQNLDKNGWYFVVSNHQSWVDIMLLQHSLKGHIPFLKFFLKQELIKVPIMGAVWWALDFPFMQRFSKAYLEKHPEMRGKDLETTRKACEKFKELPTSVVNFLEGTRFTESKHDKQQSPFERLLKPKSGGMAFAMSAMGDQFKSIVDVTIQYPDGIPTYWDFLQGKMKRVTIVVEELPIPAELRQGDYENDDTFRQDFQSWVQTMWENKDSQLKDLSA